MVHGLWKKSGITKNVYMVTFHDPDLALLLSKPDTPMQIV